MVKTIVEEILRPRLIALPWIDLFAGITIRARKQVTGQPDEIFPVSVFQSADCASVEPAVAPDHRLKSFAFIEVLGDATQDEVPGVARRMLKQWTQSVRLLVWLNSRKLGIVDPGYLFGDPLEQQLIKALTFTTSAPTLTQVNRVSVEVTAIKPKDPASLFSRYSFANKLELFVKPYDVIGLDLDITWIGDPTCVTDFVPGQEVVC